MAEHATARRTAPVHPRRVSGPSRRLAPAGAPIPRGRTGAFERISRLPDHRVVDRLLRGRACIWVIGLLLGGIVAMQVSLLRLNAGISRAVQTQETLVRQNSTLQAGIAELTSGERIAAAATSLNMVDPPAGETRYLTARPDRDPRYAAKRMKPPSERAKAIMANGGMLPGALAEPGSAAAGLAASLNGTAATASGTADAGVAAGTAAATGAAPATGTAAASAPPAAGTAAAAARPATGTAAATTSTAPVPTATPAATVAPEVTTAPPATAPQG